MLKVIGSVLLATILLSGCGKEEKPSGIVITAAEYGDRWPLKTSEARLGCEPPSVAYVEVGGKRYALNGKAIRQGMPRPDDIRKDGESFAFADFTKRALQLCENR